MSNEDDVHPRPSTFASNEAIRFEPRGGVTEKEFLRYGIGLYRAVLRGDSKTVKCIHNKSPYWISAKITKGGETALHIAAAAKHVHIVSLLLDLLLPDSLTAQNEVGNTAFCFAAVSGIVEIAEMMVKRNSMLPHIRGSQGMTPLHMAVLLGRKQMVWFLLDVTNDRRLTDEDRIELLTSSIDTDMFDVALHIQSKYRYLALRRDTKKETPLHTLARRPLKCANGSKLSMWNRTNKEENTEHGNALLLIDRLWNEVIKQKEEDISNLIGYPWRLIFVAAELGKVEFLKILIQYYPDIIWKVNEDKRTIFHIAIVHRHEEIFKLIYEIGAIKDLIATYKDDKENSMVHLAAMSAPDDRLNCVSGAALQMQREIQWFTAVKKVVRPEFTEAKNKSGQTPQALFTMAHKELREKGEDWMKKTSESCALVATLIATVVFSAAFQLPGGLNSTGSPNLVTSDPFMVFAISNAVSLFCSTSSILMFLSILTSRYAEKDFLISLPLKLMTGLILLMVSIATMIVAFTATFFITFKDGAKWVPIPIAVIAFIPVALFVLLQFPLLIDIYHSSFISRRSLFASCNSKLFESSSMPDYMNSSLNYFPNSIGSSTPDSSPEYFTSTPYSTPDSSLEYIIDSSASSCSPDSSLEHFSTPLSPFANYSKFDRGVLSTSQNFRSSKIVNPVASRPNSI